MDTATAHDREALGMGSPRTPAASVWLPGDSPVTKDWHNDPQQADEKAAATPSTPAVGPFASTPDFHSKRQSHAEAEPSKNGLALFLT